MFMTSKKMAAAVLAITVAMSLSACSNWPSAIATRLLAQVRGR